MTRDTTAMSVKDPSEINERTDYELSEEEQELIRRYVHHSSVNYSENTLRNRVTSVRQYLDYCHETNLDFLEASPIDIEDFAAHLQASQGYAVRTTRSKTYDVSTLYKRIEKRVESVQNPVPKADGIKNLEQTQLEKSDEIEYLTEEEVDKLLAAASDRVLRDELIIRLLLDTGVRVSELADIKLRNVDLNSQSIVVENAKSRENKAAKQRTVYISDDNAELIGEWLSVHRDAYVTSSESKHLLLSQQSGKIGTQRIGAIVRECAKDAGIQTVVHTSQDGREQRRVTPHLFRKTYAVRSVQNGLLITYLSDLLGHADIETTKEKYLKYSQEDIAAAEREFGYQV